MRDKNIDWTLVSKRLDNCYTSYEKISKAPQTTPQLLNKYHKVMPDFKGMEPQYRAKAQETLDANIKECILLEMRENYKSTDAESVFLIKNPLIWPMGERGAIRVKPRLLGPLADEKKSASNTKRVAFNYHADDDLD